jgi:PAS domain S-box-containing protein
MNAIERIDLDQALGRAGDGVCVVAGDGRIVLWNAAAERMLGVPRREAIGRPCCEVFAGRDADGNRLCYQGCHVMSLVKLGEPIQSFDMASRTKAGNPIWLNVTIVTFNDNGHGTGHGNGGNGNGHGLLTAHFFRDVTSAKELLSMVNDRAGAAVGREKPDPPETGLTRRELEVLRLLGRGLNTKSAADELHVSPATVRNHVQNIFGKLGVHSRLQAVAHATQHRLL